MLPSRPALHPDLSALPRRRFRRAQRVQAGLFVVGAALVGFGTWFASGEAAPVVAPAATVQAAMLPVVSVGDTNREKLAAVAAPAAVAPAAADEAVAEASEEAGTHFQTGVASYYGREFAGRRTANGERFDPNGFTAAHRTLPFGTRIRVTNPANDKTIIVRVNDRGPFHGRRVLDLSMRAAAALGLVRRGSGSVKIAVLGRGARVRAEEARQAADVPAAPAVTAPRPDPLPPTPVAAPAAAPVVTVPADSSAR